MLTTGAVKRQPAAKPAGRSVVIAKPSSRSAKSGAAARLGAPPARAVRRSGGGGGGPAQLVQRLEAPAAGPVGPFDQVRTPGRPGGVRGGGPAGAGGQH